MSIRLHKPQFVVAFAVMLATAGVLILSGSLVLAAPAANLDADRTRQEAPDMTVVTDTATHTDTSSMVDSSEHLIHHPEDATAGITETVSVSGMMGMMGEMMSVMGNMQGMMAPGMMGADMMGIDPLTTTMPMTGMMPVTGSLTVSECAMTGPMMSMMGSMMSMMGAMQTIEGMMVGHGLMGANVLTGTMPMRSTMPTTGMMPMPGSMMPDPGMTGIGMMDNAKMAFMFEHMAQMMSQMQTMVANCQQLAQTETGQPFDLGFIDSMVLHHEGAVAMAQQALEEAEHQEIRQMAEAVIEVQEAEIAQLQEWRSNWYAGAASTPGTGMDMGMMEVEEGEEPFDLRFIDAMISHHEGAIAMAQEALANAENEEIRLLAQAIIDAQQAEIAQMQEWRSAWYPEAE